MSRYITRCLTLAATLLLTPPPAGARGAEVPNAGFEAGAAEPAGWSFANQEGGRGRWEWSEDAHGGNRAVRIVKTNAAGYSTIVSDFIPVSAGTAYEIGARVRVNGRSRANVFFMVSQFAADAPDARPPYDTSPVRPAAGGPGWQRLAFAFRAREGTARVKVQALMTAAPIDVVWDDFEVREVPAEAMEYRPRVEKPKPEVLPPLERAVERLAQRQPAVAERRVVDGRPRIFLDGRMAEPVFHVTPCPRHADAHVGDFRRAGVKVHLVPLVLGRGVYGDFGPWLGKDQFDWTEVDDRLWRVLRVDPDAHVIFYVASDPYRSWADEHPDAIVRDQHDKKVVVRMHPAAWGRSPAADGQAYKERWGHSYVSADLRRDTEAALRALVRHVRGSLPGKAVAGYHIAGGGDAQFFHWVGYDPPEPSAANYHLADYSPDSRRAFVDWLGRRYGSIDGLRAAWRRPDVTFDSVQIPAGERRLAKGFFFDPRTDEDIADYNRFYSEGIAETIHGYARAIKDETRGRQLVSTYWEDVAANVDSHFATGRLLDSPDIDFLAGPTDYGVRLPGEVGECHSAWGSLMLRDRLWVSEQDWRSWLSVPVGEATDRGVGRAASAADHNNMVRRESGMMLAFGQGTWWYEMDGGWFADDGIMAGVREARAAFTHDLGAATPPRADVAVFVPERGLDYLKFDPGHLTGFRHAATVQQIRELNRSGVPYQLFLQSDLGHAELPEFKLYIFLGAYCIEPAEWRVIRALKAGGKTLCFVHAPGVIKPENVGAGTPAEAIGAVTGIRVLEGGEERPLGIQPVAAARAGTLPFSVEGMLISPWAGAGPAFAVDDGRAAALGIFDDDRTALAWRDFGDWKSVYCGGIQLSDAFVNALARHAGAWVAAEPGDAVFASQHFLTIHALHDSEKALAFRQPSRVIDLTDGSVVAEKAGGLKVPMKRGETRWFSLRANE
jgi:beta-galactosidase